MSEELESLTQYFLGGVVDTLKDEGPTAALEHLITNLISTEGLEEDEGIQDLNDDDLDTF